MPLKKKRRRVRNSGRVTGRKHATSQIETGFSYGQKTKASKAQAFVSFTSRSQQFSIRNATHPYHDDQSQQRRAAYCSISTRFDAASACAYALFTLSSETCRVLKRDRSRYLVAVSMSCSYTIKKT
ncbi:hypothetical protein EVAR_46635_1 [Eumeta japonica]|uniref:Uncharacterized protein n=1 Tax=Eumeta variegata TaxID=151549 RepID=A0A4C1WG04_EUMVA|nr:hypothetical protein EVAR_46635_1 [Eumeta japonica]